MKVGKVGKISRFGQEGYTENVQDAMLAGVGKCVDDISGKELPCQAVKHAREACMKRWLSTQLRRKVDRH